jgi:hypothetical protein
MDAYRWLVRVVRLLASERRSAAGSTTNSTGASVPSHSGYYSR